jgi:hypothetical protein
MATEVTQATPHGPAAPKLTTTAKKTPRKSELFIRKRSNAGKLRILATKHNPWTAFKTSRRNREEYKALPTKKAPFTLRLCGLLLLLAYEVLILIAISVLWILTARNNGFVDVPDTPTSVESFQNIHGAILWFYSLLWTSLPAFVVYMCAALFATTLTALEYCQPTIELRKRRNSGLKTPSNVSLESGCMLPLCGKGASTSAPKKSTAKLTIMLDYGSCWIPFQDTFHAFQNKHVLIGICTIVKWFFVMTGPLAAAIISIANVPSSGDVEVTINTFFDDKRNESSSQSAFESASAILLNGASPYPWTTNESSVVPFFASSNLSGNLTADTRSYSASLDCQLINIDSLLGAGNITLEASSGGNTTTFDFTDRGCSAQVWVLVDPSTPLHSVTRFTTCPLEVDRARLLFIAGLYDPTSIYLLGNLSLISCIPYFWNSTSRVSVLFDADNPEQSGQIINIMTNISSIERFWPDFWQTWMSDLPEYKVADATVLSDSDNFGSIAYNYAKRSNGIIDYLESVNATFSVLFAAFVTLSTYSPLNKDTTSVGSLARHANRLFVVFFPATVVTVVMGASFVVTIFIVIYANQHRDILKEHLDLILGHAILLQQNHGISSFIQRVKDSAEQQEEKNMDYENNRKNRRQRKGKDGKRKANAADSDLARTRENETVRDQFIRAAAGAATSGRDLVKYAERTPSLNSWNCWVDEKGIFHMEEPSQ